MFILQLLSYNLLSRALDLDSFNVDVLFQVIAESVVYFQFLETA